MTGLDEYHDKRYMMLDHTARRNLELTETMRSRQKQGSLLGILDYILHGDGGAHVARLYRTAAGRQA